MFAEVDISAHSSTSNSYGDVEANLLHPNRPEVAAENEPEFSIRNRSREYAEATGIQQFIQEHIDK
jgi:hypothetical protein